MASVEVTIEVRCATCGTSLSASATTEDGYQAIDVEPCDTCMEAATEEGYKNGKKEEA